MEWIINQYESLIKHSWSEEKKGTAVGCALENAANQKKHPFCGNYQV
jgi:hypothetical protein